LKKAEILFQDLLSGAIMGNFEAASIIMRSAEEYFGPEAEGPSQAVFVAVPTDVLARPVVLGTSAKRTCYRSLQNAQPVPEELACFHDLPCLKDRLICFHWRDFISRVRPRSREGNEKSFSLSARSIDVPYGSPGSLLE
jgi:hypothetical protein